MPQCIFTQAIVVLICLTLTLTGTSVTFADEPILPLQSVAIDQNKVALGRELFFDKQLSRDQSLSCSSCHKPESAFADDQKFSLDIKGKPLPLNTPGIRFVSLNYFFTWTGKFLQLDNHLDMLIQNPRIMNNDWETIVSRLQSDETYRKLFKVAGYQAINANTISDAIISFEYSLATPTRFDLYLLGDKQQLSEQEVHGYTLFKDYGCASCHQGVNIGGNMRQKFGIIKPYFDDNNQVRPHDLGFFNIRQQEENRFHFRVPSLRDVTQTPPYFHDGSAPTLNEAIRVMFEYQLGIPPNNEDISDIEAFLSSLDRIE